jgi:hypothetical protein
VRFWLSIPIFGVMLPLGAVITKTGVARPSMEILRQSHFLKEIHILK